MAKASKVEKIVSEVSIILSGDEAITLCDILNRIGGCPDTSRRAHTDAILWALEKINIGTTNRKDIRPDSSIYFT